MQIKFFLALFFLFLTASFVSAWDTNWTYKQDVNLNTALMGLSANVTQDHAILVTIPATNSLWATTRRGANCLGDLRFTNPDENVQLNWSADSNITAFCDTNIGLFWLKVTDTFNKDTNTPIAKMYYGNASATTDQNSIATYPTTYISAWNFSTNGNNSTSNSINPVTTTDVNFFSGKIGNASGYNGTSSNISYGNVSLLDFEYNSPFTFLTWIKGVGDSTSRDYASKYDSTAKGYFLRQLNNTDPAIFKVNQWCNANQCQYNYSSTNGFDGAWNLSAVTNSGGGSSISNIFLNGGSNISNVGQTIVSSMKNSANFKLGHADNSSDGYYKGYLDAFRILNYNISQDESRLLFLIENNSSYMVLGKQQNAQESVPPSVSIVMPNVSSSFDKTLVSNATVQFTIKSPLNWALIDLNLDTNVVVFSDYNAPTSVYFLCDTSNLLVDTNCTYSLSLSGVSNGSHTLTITAKNGTQTASFTTPSFTVSTSTPTPTPSATTTSTTRYINPNYPQKDTNAYYNPNTTYNKTDTEKQVDLLKNISDNMLIFIIVVIICMIVGVIAWTRK